MASRIFGAWHEGSCEECGGEIEPGDDVQFVGGVLVHADCNPEID